VVGLSASDIMWLVRLVSLIRCMGDTREHPSSGRRNRVRIASGGRNDIGRRRSRALVAVAVCGSDVMSPGGREVPRWMRLV
jgi:hypothetical protein